MSTEESEARFGDLEEKLLDVLQPELEILSSACWFEGGFCAFGFPENNFLNRPAECKVGSCPKFNLNIGGLKDLKYFQTGLVFDEKGIALADAITELADKKEGRKKEILRILADYVREDDDDNQLILREKDTE